ncbi:MAG TPA: carbon storage regulator CsrA [Candidatus Acidoferrales bacterium]|nr:carbon storage regulator CsrA [Candidatus Acidoferrales bacterium]
MLVLSRKLNQAIMIGDDVRVIVVAVDRDQVKIGIEAPREISVHRSEVYEEIRRTKKAETPASTIRGSEQPSTSNSPTTPK